MQNNQETGTERIEVETTQQEDNEITPALQDNLGGAHEITSNLQDNPDNAQVNQSSPEAEDLQLQIYQPAVAENKAELPTKKIPKEFIYLRNFMPAIVFATGTLYSFLNGLTIPGLACLGPATIAFCAGAIYSRKYSELREANKLLSRNISNYLSKEQERNNVVENIPEKSMPNKGDQATIESIIRPDLTEPAEASLEAVKPNTNTSPKKANQSQKTDLSSRSPGYP